MLVAPGTIFIPLGGNKYMAVLSCVVPSLTTKSCAGKFSKSAGLMKRTGEIKNINAQRLAPVGQYSVFSLIGGNGG